MRRRAPDQTVIMGPSWVDRATRRLTALVLLGPELVTNYLNVTDVTSRGSLSDS